MTTADTGGKVTEEGKLRDFLRGKICGTSTTEASAARMVQKAVKSAREKGWISAARKDCSVWLTGEGRAAAASTRPAGQSQGGAWIFAAGTTAWRWALDDFHPAGSQDADDVRIQEATGNLLDRFIEQ